MSRELRPLTAIPHPIVCLILRVGLSLPTDVLLRQAQYSTLRPTVGTLAGFLRSGDLTSSYEDAPATREAVWCLRRVANSATVADTISRE